MIDPRTTCLSALRPSSLNSLFDSLRRIHAVVEGARPRRGRGWSGGLAALALLALVCLGAAPARAQFGSLTCGSGQHLVFSGNFTLGSGDSLTLQAGCSATIQTPNQVIFSSGSSLEIDPGATLEIQPGGSLVLQLDATLQGSGKVTIDPGGSLQVQGNNLTLPWETYVNGVSSSNGTLQMGGFNDVLSGSVTVNAYGALKVSGPNNTISGPIDFVPNSVLRIDPGAMLVVNGPGFTMNGGAVSIGTGADLAFYGPNASIVGSTITGGPITVTSAQLTLNSSTIVGGDAGAIALWGGGIADIVDSTITGTSNLAAIKAMGGMPFVTHSTISGNSGGGIDAEGGALVLQNSIVSGNTLGGNAADISGIYVDEGGNVIGVAGGNTIDATPINLSPLGNYGGPTQTMFPLAGSPAICAGLASLARDRLTNQSIGADQRGMPLDSTCPAGSSAVDAGAVQTNRMTVTTLDDDPNITETHCTGGTCSLRGAINNVNTQGVGTDIVFDPLLTSGGSQTIQLTDELTLSADVNIQGPGANLLTIEGGNSSAYRSGHGNRPGDFRIFSVYGVTASISGLTLADGYVEINAGGAIENGGALTVTASVFAGNQAPNEGAGGAIENDGTLSVTESTFAGNRASGLGGSIENFSNSTLAITNCTFTGNSSASGGAIANLGTLSVTNSTLYANTVSQANEGAGIFNIGGTLTVANSILSGNTANGAADDIDNINGGTYSNLNGNVLGTIYTNASLVASNPVVGLSPLGSYGGPTQTMLPLPGSTAICAGSASNIPAGVTVDQRGYPRANTTYFPASSPCVDAGAVQTNYTGVKWEQQPTDAMPGAAISPAPTVKVLDNGTNAVNGVPVTIFLENAPNGALGGTLTQTTSNGAATFSGLTVNAAGTGYSLVTNPIPIVGMASLFSASSSPFDVGCPATHFAVSAPGSTDAGAPFSITVTALDASNNTAACYTGTVSFLSTDPGGSTVLPGHTFSNADGGRYTFSNGAALTTAGTWTITATDTNDNTALGSISGTSGNIAVSALPASQIAATAGTPQSVAIGGAFAQRLQATVSDSYGNPISGVTVTFAAPAGGASAVFSNSSNSITANTDGNGVASVSATANSVTGGYSVTATAGTLSASFSLTNNSIPSYVVTNTQDGPDSSPDCTSGTGSTCSLRDALTLVNSAGAAHITFASGAGQAFATAQTIQLGSGLTISGNIAITGPTTGSGATLANLVTLSGCFTPLGSSSWNDAQSQVCTMNTQSFSIFTVAPAGNVSIAGLNIVNGIAKAQGGAGVHNSGHLNLIGTVFSNHFAYGNAGGAIFNEAGGEVQIATSSFTSNMASGNGGAIENLGKLTVTGSTFGGFTSQHKNIANSAAVSGTPSGGGAIANESGASLSVIESSFWGNVASWGGAIHNDGTFNLYSSTLNFNIANQTDGAGGIACNFDNSSGRQSGTPCASMTISNSIVSGNNSSGFSSVFDDIEDGNGPGVYAGNGGNVIGNYNSSSQSDPKPNLLPLANNGGTIQTMLPQPGSPAICAGLKANIYPGVATDQRGYPNTNATYDGYSSGSPCVDAGPVQTNYSMTFSTEPPATVQLGSSFSAAVAIQESGVSAPVGGFGQSLSVALNPATGSSSPWMLPYWSGTASASDFSTTQAGQNDTLTATLTLNSTTASPLTLSVNSSPFDVLKWPSALVGPSSPPSFVYGVGGTVPVSVNSQSGIAAPSGRVSYSIDGATAQTTSLSSGATLLNVPATLNAGSHAITVNYDGDSNYNTATEITVNLTVTVAPLTVTANDASRVYGAPNPGFAGSISGAAGRDSFSESFSTAATATSDVGTYAIVPSAIGANLSDYSVTFVNGTLTVTKAGSTVTIAPVSSTIAAGQTVSLLATAASATSGTPTGSISFYDGASLLSTVPLSSGTASYSTAALAPEVTHSITAQYGGDRNFTASVSSPANVAVAQLDYTITSSGPSTGSVPPGGSISYGFAIAPVNGSYGGTVTFSATGLPPGATATFSPASIPANGGAQTVTMSIQTAPLTAAIGEHKKLAPLALALLLLPLFGARRMRRYARRFSKQASLLLLGVALAASLLLAGCGSASGFFTQAKKSYNVTITATGGNVQHTFDITLELQ